MLTNIKINEGSEKELKENSVSQEDSLANFLRDLGFKNFLLGSPYGGYQIDWGFCGDGLIDEYAISSGVFTLIRTTIGPDDVNVTLSEGGMVTRNFGKFEAPYVYLKDGRSFFFPRARYLIGEKGEGYFLVETISGAAGREQYFYNKKDPERDEKVLWYTVQELREICAMPLGHSPKNVNLIEEKEGSPKNCESIAKENCLSSGDVLRIAIIIVAFVLYVLVRPFLI